MPEFSSPILPWRFSWLGRIASIGLALALLAASWEVKADNNPPNITKGEVALLPEYCPDTQTFGYGDASYNTSPRAPYWVGLMGKTFWAMHHVCWAMIREHRARAPGLDLQMRQAHWRGAISDYEYVLQFSPPDFVLLPEIYTRIGDDWVLLGQIGAAKDSFTAARRAKPDYWPPYVSWAKVLMRAGKRQEALSHVEIAMKLAPDDAELKRQYGLLKAGQAAPAGRMKSTNTPFPHKASVAEVAPATKAASTSARSEGADKSTVSIVAPGNEPGRKPVAASASPSR